MVLCWEVFRVRIFFFYFVFGVGIGRGRMLVLGIVESLEGGRLGVFFSYFFKF